MKGDNGRPWDTLPERVGRSTASHGLNHRESKGCRPIDGKQIGVSVAQEFTLLLVVDLADEFDIRHGQQMLDFAFVVGAIHAVDFGRNLKRHVEFDGDFDGTVNTLLRRYATQEGKIFSAAVTQG